jgi:hypothetical protein
MNASRTPRLASALLTRAGVDPALIDDITDEYAAGRSSWWLWRQVFSSLVLAARGRAAEPRPHTRRQVSLTGLPTGAPIGGLGLVILVVLVSFVSPASWWLIVAGLLGGIALAAALIYLRRRRVTDIPHRLL